MAGTSPARQWSPDTFRDRLLRAIGTRPVDEVARTAELDRQTLRGFLNGRRARKMGMSLDSILRLAAALGVDPGWLAFGTGRP